MLKKCFFTKPFENQLKINKIESKRRPKTTQDRPKTASRRSCVGSFFALFFASIFDRFFVQFWCHVGTLWGAKIGHFGHRFLDDFCMLFQGRPKSGQERPKSSQEPPKSAHKRAPRAAKRAPRAAKSDPRGPQEARKENEKIKRAVQSEAGGRKENEKITRAVQGCAGLCLAVLGCS